MDTEKLLSLVAFAFVMSATPGPNNLMLLAAGANAGFRRSLPHILGVIVGVQFMLPCVALGLAQLLLRYPGLMLGMRLAGAAILVFFAWQLVRHRHAAGDARRGARPLTFWQAALFQWINPKAWLMLVTAVAGYAEPGRFAQSLALIAAAFLLVQIPVQSSWNIFGVGLQDWLRKKTRLAYFNLVMAGLLLATIVPILLVH